MANAQLITTRRLNDAYIVLHWRLMNREKYIKNKIIKCTQISKNITRKRIIIQGCFHVKRDEAVFDIVVVSMHVRSFCNV